MEEFVRLIAAGHIDVRPLITPESALDDALQAYEYGGWTRVEQPGFV